jgi:hypothetical protein
MSFNTKRTDSQQISSFDLDPFWLQSDLCDQKQADWWHNCSNYLYHRRKQPVPAKNELDIEWIDKTYNFNLEVNKQTEFAKILELVRLKNSVVKITNLETGDTERFQANQNVSIQVASYFQMVVDSLKITKKRSESLNGWLNKKTELVTLLDKSAILLKHLSEESK